MLYLNHLNLVDVLGGMRVIEEIFYKTLLELNGFYVWDVMSYLMMLVWPMVALGWVLNIFQRGSASMKRFKSIWKLGKKKI